MSSMLSMMQHTVHQTTSSIAGQRRQHWQQHQLLLQQQQLLLPHSAQMQQRLHAQIRQCSRCRVVVEAFHGLEQHVRVAAVPQSLHQAPVLRSSVHASATRGNSQAGETSKPSRALSEKQRRTSDSSRSSQQPAADVLKSQSDEDASDEDAKGELEEDEDWEYDEEAEEEEEWGEYDVDHDEAEEEEGEWDDEEEEEDEYAVDFDDEDELASTVWASNVMQISPDATTVDFKQDDFVEVGFISRPHGIRGEVKVQLITDEPQKRLGTPGKRLWLQALPLRSGLVPPSVAAARQGSAVNPFKTLRRVVVKSGRVARPGGKGQREEWAVLFDGVKSKEQAAMLAGHKLLLALCDREARPRGRDEFFVDQLVGLKAVDAASSVLVGIVTEVYDNAASYSLLRIRLAPEEADIAASKYRSVLVPFVTEMVPVVDMAGGLIQLSLPEGLLDTASSTKLGKQYTREQQQQLRQQMRQRHEQLQQWQAQQQS